jgi:hypothetical protein
MHALVPLASKEEIGMSAFVIVESTVRDREPLGRYTAQAEPITRCVMAAGTRPTTRRVPGNPIMELSEKDRRDRKIVNDAVARYVWPEMKVSPLFAEQRAGSLRR